jgi:Flp pilus assembly protein TadG
MGDAGRRRRRGQSLVEFVMLAPWFIFLFIGAFDWGFFAHGLISTESAARVGAIYNAWDYDTQAVDPGSTAANKAACAYALSELRTAVNISGSLTTCTSLPVIVTATKVLGPDGANAAQVAVEYQTQNLIPIPGLLGSQYTFYRIVKMKL